MSVEGQRDRDDKMIDHEAELLEIEKETEGKEQRNHLEVRNLSVSCQLQF
jgi:hypothetical protein